MIGYQESMWDEWGHRNIENKRHAMLEMAGIFSAFHTGEGLLQTQRTWVFRRLQRLWEKAGWGEDVVFSGFLNLPKTKKQGRKICFTLPEEKKNILENISNHEVCSLPEKEFFLWVAGLWGGGHQYFPQYGYYISMRLLATSYTKKELLLQLQKYIKASSRFRHGKVEILLRDAQSIYSFFVMIQLPLTALRFDEITVMRSVRNKTNKVVNCDNANIQKTLAAAERHVYYCQEVKRLGLISSLSREIQELVHLRIENPTLSLKEIGSAMKCKVSKSTVEYRLKKIEKLVLSVSGDEGVKT